MDNMVNKDLFNPSYTFRVRISKSYINCHSKWNLLKVESREKNTGWAQESTEEDYTFETVIYDNMVKKDLFNPSYTFKVRISKS